MSIIAVLTALGASLSWAAGAMIAHTPAKRLGAFEFTRTQLISSSALLAVLVTWAGLWSSVSLEHWPHFIVGSSIGVIASNLAMAACLRRGGPRRTQLLLSMNVPFAATLGWLFLGEIISLQKLIGAAIAMAGIVLAIFYARPNDGHLEPLHGPLGSVVLFGFLAAASQAIGLVAMKPAMMAGTEPLAASALRTGSAAAIVSLIALWPAKAFAPASERTGTLILWTILPGILGYVVAVSLLLFALRHSQSGIAAVFGSMSPVMMLPMTRIAGGQWPPLPAWTGAALVVGGGATILFG